jgi:hypothetical protein
MYRAAEAGRVDEAWCCARALVVAKQATADERAVYDRYRDAETTKAIGILDRTAWAWVRHPDEDVLISALFAAIWQGPIAAVAGSPKDFELRPRERLPVEDGTRVIAKIFRHAARVLDTLLPEVYVQPRRQGRLFLANCVDKGRLLPAVIVGRDLMAGYRDTEIAAEVGAMLALLRPSYYLQLCLDTDRLQAALAAALQVGGRPDLVPAHPEAARLVDEIQRRMSPAARDQLEVVVGRLSGPPDLARWIDAVEMTSRRASLLVCGELGAAMRMMSTGPGGVTPRHAADLFAYSTSDSYLSARAHLGVAVARSSDPAR